MRQRKWLKSKRAWAVILFLVLCFVSEMEWAKFRYHKAQLIQQTLAKGQTLPRFSTLTVEGKQLNYLEVGDQDSLPLVVFVHGSPGALNAYEDYFSDTLLSKEATMIAVDRLGFGYSDFGISVASMSTQAALIAALLKKYPSRKKILIGHSMGGPVIAKLAMEYPNLVDGLIMVAPSISPDLEPSNTWRKLLDFPLIRWITPAALRVCNQEIIPLKEELDLMIEGWKFIVVPVTVIQGMEDSLVPMGNAYFAKKMINNNSNVKTKMLAAGDHFILWSELSLIKQEILEMVAGL